MKPQTPVYSGSAFHPVLAEGEVAGRITIDPQKLLFESGDGNVELSLDRLSIERDAAGRVLFSEREQTDWLVYADGEQVLKNYFLNRHNRLRSQAREIRQQLEGKRTLKLAGIFLAAFTAVVVAVWFLTGWTINFLVRQVPVSWEAQLADSVYEDLRERIKPVNDPEKTAELQAVAERLAAAMPDSKYKFHLQLVQELDPNAFALPGGRILVTTGLFAVAKRPEEIAGVLAHEMAHVTRRHGLRQIIAAAGPYYVLRIFVGNKRGFASLISNGSQLLVRQSYSRDLEREADETGWHYLEAANIDPRGLSDFLKKLMANPIVRMLESSPLQVLNSHPPTMERVEHLEALWERAKKKSGFVTLPAFAPQ